MQKRYVLKNDLIRVFNINSSLTIDCLALLGRLNSGLASYFIDNTRLSDLLNKRMYNFITARDTSGLRNIALLCTNNMDTDVDV